jgi:hypothetical protein
MDVGNKIRPGAVYVLSQFDRLLSLGKTDPTAKGRNNFHAFASDLFALNLL